MAISPNRFSDPALGAAFSGLAAAFAPPSGSDLAGYATAAAKKEEAARLAQLFTTAGGTDFNQPIFDRQAIAAGLYNPTQSFYAQDQNNSTAIYGHDTTAATSRLNNTADNEQAMMAAVLKAASDPVAQDAARPAFNPADFGVASPAVPAFAGPRSPLSETQVAGGILAGLPAADQAASVLGDIPVEQVIMDGVPQFVRRNDAPGLTPYDKPSGATETQNYRTADGKSGTAYFDTLTNSWIDTTTQAPLPQGAITFNSSLQGGAAETGLAPTTANTTTANQLEATLNAMDADIVNLQGLLQNNAGIAGTPGAIFGAAQDLGSVAAEIGAAFGSMSPDAAVTAEQVQNIAQQITPNRNPAIMQYNMGVANLAYRLAQMNNPSGEVSRQAYERSLASLQGGMLANNQSALEALDALQQQVDRDRQTRLGTLRNPGQTPPTAPAPPTAPTPPSAADAIYATNPATGERLQLINDQWVPVQ